MGNIIDKMRLSWRWLRGYISPTFIVLLCSSFILWYILKLQYTYTTNYPVLVNVDGEHLRVPCVVEGKGSNLFGYLVYMHKEIKIPLSDLKYVVALDSLAAIRGDSIRVVDIDPQSMQSAISVRFSDIKVVSVGDIPPLHLADMPTANSK